MSEARKAILALLDRRGAGKTICPSEAAKELAGADSEWRDRMDDVHEAVDKLLATGAIAISWKGTRKEQRRGPYRIARR